MMQEELKIGDIINVGWMDFDDEGAWPWWEVLWHSDIKAGLIRVAPIGENGDIDNIPVGIPSMYIDMKDIIIIERLTTPAPAPVDVTSAVMGDLIERSNVGKKKYGDTLRAGSPCCNNKSNLQNLYEEILDAACYMKKELMERGE